MGKWGYSPTYKLVGAHLCSTFQADSTQEGPQRREQHTKKGPERREQHTQKGPERQEQHTEEGPQRREQHTQKGPKRREQHQVTTTKTRTGRTTKEREAPKEQTKNRESAHSGRTARP